MSTKGSKYDYNTPQPWKSSAPVRYQTCQYWLYDGHPHQCGEPTHGKQKCPECDKRSMAAAPKFFGGLTRRGADA